MTFAEIACWCEHDCCEATTGKEKRALQKIGITPAIYDCDSCECHGIIEDMMAWDDATWD